VLQIALREDDRLATLPPKQLLRELARAGHMSSLNLLADNPIQLDETRPPTGATSRWSGNMVHEQMVRQHDAQAGGQGT